MARGQLAPPASDSTPFRRHANPPPSSTITQCCKLDDAQANWSDVTTSSELTSYPVRYDHLVRCDQLPGHI